MNKVQAIIDDYEKLVTRLQTEIAKLRAAMPDPDKLDFHAGELIPINMKLAQSLWDMATKIREAKS